MRERVCHLEELQQSNVSQQRTISKLWKKEEAPLQPSKDSEWKRKCFPSSFAITVKPPFLPLIRSQVGCSLCLCRATFLQINQS